MKVRGYRVFYIDQGSGIKDLIDLMENTTAIKMALVVKNGQLILNSSVNLKLLHDYGKKYRKELVIVNPEPIFAEKVCNAGFMIYKDLNTLEAGQPIKGFEADNHIAAVREDESGDNFTGKSAEKSGKYFSRLFTFLIILILVCLAYFYFIYPTVIVEIEPVMNNAVQEITVSASSGIRSIDWEKNILPIHQTQLEINSEEKIAVSGVKLIGEKKAGGVVRFISEKESEVQIPAGTIVRTDSGFEYCTVENIVLPSLEIDYLMNVPVGMKAGQKEVRVEALSPGSRGNANIGKINTLVEKIEDVHVINPEPISGGTDKRIPQVGAEDFEKARKLLEEKLDSNIFATVYQKLGGNYRIIEDSISYSDVEYKYSNKIGDEIDLLTVTGRIVTNVYLIKNSEVDRLLTRRFQENLADDVVLMSSGINIESLQLEEKEKNMYNIKIRLNAPVMSVIDSSNLSKRIAGLKILDAEEVLNEISFIENFKIRSESSRLPKMGFAIKIVVTEPEDIKVFKLNE